MSHISHEKETGFTADDADLLGCDLSQVSQGNARGESNLARRGRRARVAVMKSRFASVAVMALALGAVLPALWIWLPVGNLNGVSYQGVPDSYLLLSVRDLLKWAPAWYVPVLQLYSLAALLASGLALLLVVRAGTVKAALCLAGALGGLAFFAAQLMLTHNIPVVAVQPWMPVLDAVSQVAYFLSLWFMLQAAARYPQAVDWTAVKDFNQLAVERKFFARSRQMTNKSRWRQALTDLDAGAGLEMQQIVNSWWPPALLCAIGVGSIFKWYGAPGKAWPLFALMLNFAIIIPAIAWSLLEFQYRTGSPEDRRRIGWLALGLAICGWLAVIAYGGAMVWLILGGGDQAAMVLVKLTAVLPALCAIIFTLLLAISIFFRGAIDPRLAIRKTSLYGLVALVVTVVVAATQNTAVVQLVGSLGLPAQSGSVFAGVAVAVVMTPMRRLIEVRMERAVDRFLPASTLAESAREQATVVFADLSGYTELSAKDEPKALTLASLLHKESRRWAERHSGRVVKTIGDAVLFTFAGPGEAAAMCTDLNKQFAVAAGALQLPALPLHFGIHAGEVVRQRDGDVFGGTVNLAARLQGLAKAGELVVSAVVAGPLREAGFNLESLGDQKLKNVPAPVACFRVTLS